MVLRDHLRNTLLGSPGSSHHLIAHSHGGNIAAIAVDALDKLVSKTRLHLLTLGTPFFWKRNREAFAGAAEALPWINAGATIIRICLWCGPALAFFWSIKRLALDYPQFGSSFWRYRLVLIGYFFYFISAVPAVVGDVKSRRAADTLFKDLAGIAHKSANDSYSLSLGQLKSVMIVQPPADEAWLSLMLPALAIWLNQIVGASASRMTPLFKRSEKIVMIAYCVFFAVICVLAYYHRVLRWWSVVVLFGPFLSIGLAALCQNILFAAIGAAGGLTMMALGFRFSEGLALMLASDIHVEQYPDGGPWSVMCPRERLKGLHHSLYESPEVCQIILNWLDGQVGTSPRSV
jgi:hypothetical protein